MRPPRARARTARKAISYQLLGLRRAVISLRAAAAGTPSQSVAAGAVGFTVFWMVAGLTDSHFFSTYSLNGIIFSLAYWHSATGVES
jgi:hypothetical protein